MIIIKSVIYFYLFLLWYNGYVCFVLLMVKECDGLIINIIGLYKKGVMLCICIYL